jgi:hypothetical protein
MEAEAGADSVIWRVERMVVRIVVRCIVDVGDGGSSREG